MKRGVKAGVDEADKEVPAILDAAPLEVPPPPVVEDAGVDAPPPPPKTKKKHKAPVVHAP